MALRYAYHPGNVAHSNAIEVADTMPAAADSLGIELVDLDGAPVAVLASSVKPMQTCKWY